MRPQARHSLARALVLGSFAALSVVAWAACGSDDEAPPPAAPDGGTLDARSDSSPTPTPDAGKADSTTTDAGTDAGADASPEAGDSGPGANSDAGTDAGATPELFGTIGTSLVKINTTTGAATLVGTTNLGSVAKLAFHAGNGKLYGILDYLTAPKLVTVDACTGESQQVAALTIAAGTVHFVGGLDYNPTDNKLYASASLDQAYPADSIEEALVSVDPTTGVVTSVGTMREGVAIVDGDNVAFSATTKLAIDGNPDDGGTHTFWDLNMADAAATGPRTAAGALGWIEFHKGALYGTVSSGALARNLVTINAATGAVTVVGPTHGVSDFGGQQILAISEGLCAVQTDH